MQNFSENRGIVHIGCGAFHRAHQLNYTHLTNLQSDEQWRYHEVDLRFGLPLMQALKAQNWRYHLLEKGMNEQPIKEISVIADGFHSDIDGADAIIERMSQEDIKIVSLTITEKGYYVDPASGKLDLSHPVIKNDLTNEAEPQSAIGYIVRALQRRKARGLNGFTVMSCDNLMENGHIIQQAVLCFSEQISSELTEWIKENVTFPCTMVDRIVPAVTDATLAEVKDRLGFEDPCAVASEDFRQWVIEEKFVAGRPAWEKAGAQFVSDVRPFEEMKLRMLNGSHSFLAYLGYLAGFEHISDCMQNADFVKAARLLMETEQAPTLRTENIDLQDYANTLIERFKNPNILHRTWQIAMDGSQKLPPRLLASIRFHLDHNNDFSLLALAVAGWMRYVSGVDEKGEAIEVKDPMSEQFADIYAQHGLNLSAVDALLALNQIFPEDLVAEEHFVKAVKDAYQSLLDHGSQATVARYVANRKE